MPWCHISLCTEPARPHILSLAQRGRTLPHAHDDDETDEAHESRDEYAAAALRGPAPLGKAASLPGVGGPRGDGMVALDELVVTQ